MKARTVPAQDDTEIHDSDVYWMSGQETFEAFDDDAAAAHVAALFPVTDDGPAVLLITDTEKGAGHYRILVFERRRA